MPIRICWPRLTVRIHADRVHRLVPEPQKASAYMPPNISRHATPATRTSLNMKSRLTTKETGCRAIPGEFNQPAHLHVKMLGITQKIAENEIIHTASELAQKKRQQHKIPSSS